MKEIKTNNVITEMHGEMSDSGNELGMIKIHENVIVSIVKAATVSIDGVSRLAGSSLVDNIADLVGSKRIAERSITVELNGANVSVEVKVNIAYQAHIPTVAAAVQNKIVEAVEASTGMTVENVNIVIQEVDFEAPTDDDENENEVDVEN